MISYYKEIESKEFPLYLKNSFGRTEYVRVQDVRLPDWFFNKYSLLLYVEFSITPPYVNSTFGTTEVKIIIPINYNITIK